ncbi:MAG: hypothetical protein R3F14_25440 [Polyangiaceae bacterium]
MSPRNKAGITRHPAIGSTTSPHPTRDETAARDEIAASDEVAARDEIAARNEVAARVRQAVTASASTANSDAIAPSGRTSGARNPSPATTPSARADAFSGSSSSRAARRVVATSTHASASVSIPLHANQANGPNARHIAPAATPYARLVSRSASRAVSTASPAWQIVPSPHATHRSDSPRAPIFQKGASNSGHTRLVVPDVGASPVYRNGAPSANRRAYWKWMNVSSSGAAGRPVR